MNTVDIILLICFIPALISGIRKGFVGQIITIISIIASIWISFEFTTLVGEWLGQHIEAEKELLNIIAFTIILVGVSIAFGLCRKPIEGLINLLKIGWVNRLLGGAFSLITSTLVIGLIIIAFEDFNETFQIVSKEYLEESILYSPIKYIAQVAVFPYLKGIFA